MRLLLDTQVLVWLLEGKSLSKRVYKILQSTSNEVFVSVVSAWEIAIKERSGTLRIPRDWEDQLDLLSLQRLPVDFSHIQGLKSLPLIHKDPFDRLLMAQAVVEGLTLATHDGQILQYPITTLEV